MLCRDYDLFSLTLCLIDGHWGCLAESVDPERELRPPDEPRLHQPSHVGSRVAVQLGRGRYSAERPRVDAELFCPECVYNLESYDESQEGNERS